MMLKYRFILYNLASILIVVLFSLFRKEEALLFFSGWTLWYEPVFAGMVCGTMAALTGVYMLLNRIVFMSIATAQGAGLGIFLAFFIAGFWNLHIEDSPLALFCGFLMASCTVFFFMQFRKKRHLPDEVIIGLIYVICSGSIVILGDQLAEGRHHIDNLLFGNAVAVTQWDLNLLGLVSTALIALHFIFRREFLYSSADPDFMSISGMKTKFWQTLLYLTLIMSITASLKTLGSLPVFGMMLIPPYISLNNANNPREVFFTSLLLGILIPPLGYYFSYLYSFPTGACIIMTASYFVVISQFESKITHIMPKKIP